MMDTQTVLVGAICFLGFICVYFHLKVFSFWSSRNVKGPTPWPILGTNIYYLFKNKILVDQEWKDKYGRTYGIYDGYDPLLRTTDSELIKFIWIKKFTSFTDRNSSVVFSDHLSRWLFFAKGSQWNNRRMLITPMFTSAKLKTMFDTSQNCMNRLMVEINSKVESHSSCDERATGIFSRDEIMSAALDVIANSFFGVKLDTYRDKKSDFYKQAFAFGSFEIRRFIIWLLIPYSIKKFISFELTPYSKYEYFDKLSQSLIDERRKDPSKRRNDFIQALLDAEASDTYEKVFTEEDSKDAHYNDQINHQELEKINEDQAKRSTLKRFDDLDIRASMTFLFLAGFETTSSAISFCLYELGHQQEAQEELHQELIGSQIEQFDYSKLSNLNKLNAFISESLRLYSAVTENSRRVTAPEGIELPSSPPIKLPYDCGISVNGFVLQRDPDYWPEPLKFDMSRFYPEKKDSIVSCSYMPFGLGPRNCAGMRFALMTIRLCLAHILINYQVVPGPKSQKYPPEFRYHAFFLQQLHNDFQLISRNQEKATGLQNN